MATKLARMMIYLDKLLTIKSYKALSTRSCKVTRQTKTTISLLQEFNLDRMVTSLDGLLPIMSDDALITWPCEIRGSLTGGGSARKRLSRHRLLFLMRGGSRFGLVLAIKCLINKSIISVIKTPKPAGKIDFIQFLTSSFLQQVIQL